MTKEKVIFEIPTVNLSGFLASIKKLQKKAEKIGIGSIKIETIKTWVKISTKEFDGFDERIPYTTIKATGEAPIIEGWMFIASLQFSEEYGVLVSKVSGADETIPYRYLENDGDALLCEHCYNRRARRRAYIVRNIETGEWKQVGSSCVKDFTGHITPEKLARYWGFLTDLDGIDAEDWGLRGKMSKEEYGYFGLGEFLTRVSSMTREYGFVSKAKAREDELSMATVDDVISWIEWAKSGRRDRARFSNLTITDADAEWARKAIEWAQNIDEDETMRNEFLYNLKKIAEAGTVPIYHTGFAGYMIEAYKKAMGLQEKREGKEAKEYYPGEIKDRVEIGKVKVVFHTAFETQYGMTHLYRFEQDNYVFTWFASSGKGLQEGDIINITGTIKDKTEYKGTKQTVLTRCKLSQ